MLSQMKRPRYGGIGKRNSTVEAIRIAAALRQEQHDMEAKQRAARPAAAPMDPSARALVYAGKPTPRQARRMERKADQWHRRGLGVSGVALPTARELPEWDAAECSCHINPPCGYCERGEYKEL